MRKIPTERLFAALGALQNWLASFFAEPYTPESFWDPLCVAVRGRASEIQDELERRGVLR